MPERRKMDRRKFLERISLAAGGSYLLFSGFTQRAEAISGGYEVSSLKAYGFGQLTPVATKNTGEKLLALPKGFEYNVFGLKGKMMSDGRPTPPAHDGMATFKVGKELRVVRNHEVSNRRVPIQGSGIGKRNHYDESAGGGTTTLVIDPVKRELVRDFVSLSGTLVNCAGGPTPWGSWISCEETTLGPSIRTDSKGAKTGGFLKPHGYCFEVPASANSEVVPVPLKAMGRFEHEAIAVDAKSGVVYLTEDAGPGGFYRFLPKRANRLAEGGVLQILKIKGKDNYQTKTGQKVGGVLEAEWVTIENPDPESADLDPRAVFKEGASKGAASFQRLEGCISDSKGRIYFDATSGGDNGGGQIWMYEPVSKESGKLTLIFESPDRNILDMPDNICLRPNSQEIFICEDSDYVGEGGTAENLVRIMTTDGKIADFAKNIAPGFETGEFAGAVFSPDGKTLFLNIQTMGATLAIWGDWGKFRV